MEKQDYELRVSFITDNDKLMYKGISWYNRQIIDEVNITESRISVFFSETIKKESGGIRAV